MTLTICLAACSDDRPCSAPRTTNYGCEPAPLGSAGCQGGPLGYDRDKAFPLGCNVVVPECNAYSTYPNAPRSFQCGTDWSQSDAGVDAGARWFEWL